MTPAQRHRCMSRIRSRDTGPELIVRRFLWSHGYRYRLYRRDLPGTPDIVLQQLRTVIMVNGCFWHGHYCNTRHPRTNVEFWRSKIARNIERDSLNTQALHNQGWNVIVIWECELERSRRQATLTRLQHTLDALKSAPLPPAPYSFPQADTMLAADADIEYGNTTSPLDSQ